MRVHIPLPGSPGRSRAITRIPQRIVSLVPSDTRSLFALGAGDRLVGRTDYCLDGVDRIAAVGGTKNPDVAKILDLKPDLVLANQEENSKGDIQKLMAAGVVVLVAFPKRVAEGIANLALLARILGVEGEAGTRDLLGRAYRGLQEAEARRKLLAPVRAFVPIWMDPLMTIHGDTFISDMMDLCGAYNVFSDRPRRYPLAADLGTRAPLPPEKIEGRDTRYPRVTRQEVEQRAPEIVLLPDEPHPFTEADAEVFRALSIPAAISGTVVRCPGMDLCWPGAQSVEGLARMSALVDALRAKTEASCPAS